MTNTRGQFYSEKMISEKSTNVLMFRLADSTDEDFIKTDHENEL